MVQLHGFLARFGVPFSRSRQVLLVSFFRSQREHQQLLGRKAERDKQAAAMAKRVEAQQEQLAAAERLATEQAGEATGGAVAPGR